MQSIHCPIVMRGQELLQKRDGDGVILSLPGDLYACFSNWLQFSCTHYFLMLIVVFCFPLQDMTQYQPISAGASKNSMIYRGMEVGGKLEQLEQRFCFGIKQLSGLPYIIFCPLCVRI